MCVCSGSQLCLTLCSPIDYSLPGSSVHGILQARILEQVAISYSTGFSQAKGLNRIEPVSLAAPALAGRFFATSTTWGAPVQKLSDKNFNYGEG